jgi:hypothetical protein
MRSLCLCVSLALLLAPSLALAQQNSAPNLFPSYTYTPPQPNYTAPPPAPPPSSINVPHATTSTSTPNSYTTTTTGGYQVSPNVIVGPSVTTTMVQPGGTSSQPTPGTQNGSSTETTYGAGVAIEIP